MEIEIGALETALKLVEQNLQPLLRQKATLSEYLDIAKSKKFISDNNITKENVQRDDDEGMPRMGNAYVFGEWLDKNATKPWCCWNGRVYSTKGMIMAHLDRDRSARYEDLP